ncbi:MAG: endo-1,4-beta-xylanase [Kiritimatiellia bacterium]|nr:endo-1,4-beta-xylanase [Kiritimatiellia bacterium]
MNSELAQKLTHHLLREDPAVEDRIQTGIETHRKGYGQFILSDRAGNPVPAATIQLRQTGHEFQFGCNAFMVEQFTEKEKNAAYEERFRNLFNLAVVPFYWSDLEPEEGHLRFDRDASPIYRRPPPDLVLDFCERNHLTPKGHPLLWHLFRPGWLSQDPQIMKERIHRHFREISERYASRIKIWDVCNEAQTSRPWSPFHSTRAMPENHVEWAFELAARYFPDAIRTYNDDNMWFRFSGNYSPVYLLMQSLLARGYAVNALGLQYHMFDGLLPLADHFMNPDLLFRCLDQYGKLNVPINFSEVSIISRRDLGDGDQFQKLVTEKLYRIWFSHPAVNGIVWWNMVDGTAAYAPMGSEEGENRLRAGLVNYDLTPKPAYTALQNLVKKEWRTDVSMDYRAGAINSFKGFYGDYEVVVTTDQGTFKQNVRLLKKAINEFRITCR